MSRLGGLIECIFLWRGVCWMNEWGGGTMEGGTMGWRNREEQWCGGNG